VREGGTLLVVTGEETELGDADFMLMDFSPINIAAWNPPEPLDTAPIETPPAPPETETAPLTAASPATPPMKGRVRVDTHITTQKVELIPWGEHLFVAHSLDLIELEEEVIVSRTARVVEEIVIARNFAEKVETVHDTVRRTDVIVEETEPPIPAGPTADKRVTEQLPVEKAEAEPIEADRIVTGERVPTTPEVRDRSASYGVGHRRRDSKGDAGEQLTLGRSACYPAPGTSSAYFRRDRA
jgi:hypothetical protein